MKYISLIWVCVFLASCQSSKNKGFEGVYQSDKGDFYQLRIIEDAYISTIEYTDEGFRGTYGGTYVLKDNRLEIKREFDDRNPNEVGKETKEEISLDQAGFIDGNNIRWIKKKTNPQDLDGLWQISGRMKEGTFEPINHRGGRKTIKLLKDGYFQWIALDPDKGKFYGTGGGEYTFKDGEYTERIMFFSKDDSRVGAELNFSGELKDGDWHHRGKSSKGDSLHEVWVRKKEN